MLKLVKSKTTPNHYFIFIDDERGSQRLSISRKDAKILLDDLSKLLNETEENDETPL